MEGYNCFGCSPDNEAGVRMEFYEDGDEIGFVNSIELVIQDSISQITIYLPTNVNEGKQKWNWLNRIFNPQGFGKVSTYGRYPFTRNVTVGLNLTF